MKRSVRTAVLLALCLALALVLWQRSRPQNAEKSVAAPSTVAQPASAAVGQDSIQDTPVPSPRPDRAQSPSDKRNTLRAELSRAKKQREARGFGLGSHARENTGNSDSPDTGSDLKLANKTGSDTDWDRDQITVLNQLLGECYDIAKEQQPGLAGTIGLQFTLRGEPEIGGIVEEIEFVEEHSTIAFLPMRECMQESLYALELDPPEEGVQIERMITMKLSDDDDSEKDEN